MLLPEQEVVWNFLAHQKLSQKPRSINLREPLWFLYAVFYFLDLLRRLYDTDQILFSATFFMLHNFCMLSFEYYVQSKYRNLRIVSHRTYICHWLKIGLFEQSSTEFWFRIWKTDNKWLAGIARVGAEN